MNSKPLRRRQSPVTFTSKAQIVLIVTLAVVVIVVLTVDVMTCVTVSCCRTLLGPHLSGLASVFVMHIIINKYMKIDSNRAIVWSKVNCIRSKASVERLLNLVHNC